MDGDILRNVIVNDNSGNGIENAKKWSVETDLQIGDLVASDRTTGSKAYKFTDIPEELLGSEWIRTPVESRSATNDDVVSYYLSSDADVYVAYDARIRSEPEWLTENYEETDEDRKSTRLNSSHVAISYAVFCLKKKKKKKTK